jgi:hypothetical protein
LRLLSAPLETGLKLASAFVLCAAASFLDRDSVATARALALLGLALLYAGIFVRSVSEARP